MGLWVYGFMGVRSGSPLTAHVERTGLNAMISKNLQGEKHLRVLFLGRNGEMDKIFPWN